MVINVKLSGEARWKAIQAKAKLKDDGLLRLMADFNRLAKADDAALHLDRLGEIDGVLAKLQKDRALAANKDAAKCLTELSREVAKASATIGQLQKRLEKDAAAAKSRDESDGDSAEDEEEAAAADDLGSELLGALSRIRAGGGKLKLKCLVVQATPLCGMILAKSIGQKHREQLLSALGGGGGRVLPVGECGLEDGRIVVSIPKASAGLAKKLQDSVKHYTGKKFALGVCDSETGLVDDAGLDEDESEEEDDGGASSTSRQVEDDEAEDESEDVPFDGPGTKRKKRSEEDDEDEDVPSDGPGTARKRDADEDSDDESKDELREELKKELKDELREEFDAERARAASGADEITPEAVGTTTESLPNAVAGAFSIRGSVGRGGKNLPEDVKAVQAALNRRTRAGLTVNGRIGPKTVAAIEAFQKSLGQGKPDGRVDVGRGTARALAASGPLPPPPEPPKPIAPPKLPKPDFKKAHLVWRGTRGVVETNIGELKKGVKGHYANEHPGLVAEIDKNLVKLHAILDRLDDRLAASIEKANAAATAKARAAELAVSKAILADYIKYVRQEPLIQHVDKNPFGVRTSLQQVLMASLKHMGESLALAK